MQLLDNASWIVGYDGRERSEGALRLIRWLDAHTDFHWSFRGVHVLEHDTDARYEPVGMDEAQRREDTRILIDRHPAGPGFDGLEIVHARQVADALEALTEDRHADGLVIGRAAATGSREMVRLGRVARKLVAHAAFPLVVVPPELQPETLEEGPVLVGCDLGEGSVEAARFGVELAGALGRQCMLTHVAGEEIPGRRTVIPAVSDVADKLETSRSQLDDRFVTWASAHGFASLPRIILPGPAVSGLLSEAREQGACAIVVGSRRLSAAQRLVRTSVSSNVAATSWLPVFIVPAV